MSPLYRYNILYTVGNPNIRNMSNKSIYIESLFLSGVCHLMKDLATSSLLSRSWVYSCLVYTSRPSFPSVYNKFFVSFRKNKSERLLKVRWEARGALEG